MLRITSYRQSPSYCGPTSLRMVLKYYGIDVAEKKLGQLSDCTFEEGTTAEGLKKAAKQFGCKTLIFTDGRIADLRTWVVEKEIPVIVHWFSVDTGHYSVVVDVTSTNIVLQDPDTGKKRRFSHAEWYQVWFGFRKTWIRGQRDLLLRRYIVVLPPSVSQ